MVQIDPKLKGLYTRGTANGHTQRGTGKAQTLCFLDYSLNSLDHLKNERL